jgi:prevent-host-death family protein
MAKVQRNHDLQVSTVKARATFAEVINRAAYGRERIVLTRRGKRIAAVVPFEDVRILERLEDEIDIREARKARKEYERKGGIPWEEIKAKLKI